MNGHNTIQIACRRCKADSVPDSYVKAMEESCVSDGAVKISLLFKAEKILTKSSQLTCTMWVGLDVK